MTITPEEMRDMAARLDNSSPWSDTKQCDRNLSLASQMLRSIAAEREAESKWFDTNGFSDEFLAEIAAKNKGAE